MPYYHVNDDFSKAQGIDGDLNLLVMNYFYEPVDNDEDWIIAVSLPIYPNWQTRDKIYQ